MDKWTLCADALEHRQQERHAIANQQQHQIAEIELARLEARHKRDSIDKRRKSQEIDITDQPPIPAPIADLVEQSVKDEDEAATP